MRLMLRRYRLIKIDAAGNRSPTIAVFSEEGAAHAYARNVPRIEGGEGQPNGYDVGAEDYLLIADFPRVVNGDGTILRLVAGDSYIADGTPIDRQIDLVSPQPHSVPDDQR